MPMRCERLMGLCNVVLVAAVCAGAMAISGRANASDRFVLVVTREVASDAFIRAAVREAGALGGPTDAAAVVEQLSRAFPALGGEAPMKVETLIDTELKPAEDAHYATEVAEAERRFALVYDRLAARPDMLRGDSAAFQKLSDGAAMRFRNSAAAGNREKALADLERFLRLYPEAQLTRDAHPPQTVKVWSDLQAKITADEGVLQVHALPLESEREGHCALLVNGAERGFLPQAGRIKLPKGTHGIQVRCLQRFSWLQRVEITDTPLTVKVPVRAMNAAQLHPATGAIVLTKPDENDAKDLVEAISVHAGFEGAITVRTTIAKAAIGNWGPGSDGPSCAREGYLEREGADGMISNIVRVEKACEHEGGRLWTWVSAGAGVAALAGGVVTNVLQASAAQDANDSEPFDSDAGDRADTLETTSIVLYAAGGALLAAGIVLFFVEDSGESDASARLFTVEPDGATGLAIRF